MSTRYKKSDQVPTGVICNRLDEISRAIAEGNDGELTMRIPAELDRDADVVLSEASKRLRKLSLHPTNNQNGD